MEITKTEKIIKRSIKYFLIFCVYAVIAFILIRIWMGSYYPKSVKELYITDNLESHYSATGEIKAYTQKINTPYDQWEGLGTFFSAALVFVPDAGEVQFVLRCNDSIDGIIYDRYGHDVEYYSGMFTFALRDNEGNEYVLSHKSEERKFFYNYTKLAFCGIDFNTVDQLIAVVYYAGASDDEPFAEIYIYEDPAQYNYVHNEEYKLSKSELPQ